MNVTLITPISKPGTKFAGNIPTPSSYLECSIPYPQPQAFWWNAMKRLGCNVSVVPFINEDWPGLPMPLTLSRLTVRTIPSIMRFAGPAAMYLQNFPPVEAFNNMIVEKVLNQKPDMIMISSGITSLSVNTIKKFKKMDIKLVLARGTPLSTHPSKNESQMAEFFDLIIVNDPNHKIGWTLCGAKNVIDLPISAFEPDFHSAHVYSKSTDKLEDIDISFVGSLEPIAYYGSDRIDMLRSISDLGLHIYSPSPGSLKNYPNLMKCYKGIAKQSDIPKIIHRSKINLNILGRFMPGGGNYRTFEIAGGCGFQICNTFQSHWFEEGKEIVKFISPENLRELCKYYLENAKKRNEIARAGYERAISQHTFLHRFKKVFEILKYSQGNQQNINELSA